MSAIATKAAPAAQSAKPVAVVPAQVKAPVAAPVQYIQLLVANNPKKVGSKSHPRFAAYKHGMSVAAYQQAVVALGFPAKHARLDLAWDQRHGFIALHATSAACGSAPVAPPAKS